MTLYDGFNPEDRRLAPQGTPNVNRIGCVYVWDADSRDVREIGQATTLEAAKAICRLYSGRDDFIYWHASSLVCAMGPEPVMEAEAS